MLNLHDESSLASELSKSEVRLLIKSSISLVSVSLLRGYFLVLVPDAILFQLKYWFISMTTIHIYKKNSIWVDLKDTTLGKS